MKGIILLMLVGVACATQYKMVPSDSLRVCQNVNHAVFQHPEACDKYVLCLFYQEMVVYCPPNTIFDPLMEDCCEGDPETCEPSTPTEPSTTTPSTTTTTEEPTTPNWRSFCANFETGNQPYPTDCTLFVSCLLGFGSLKQCPQGQIFFGTTCVPGDEATCEPF